MRTKRNGMSLIELLAAFAMVTAVLVASAEIFRSMVHGMTRGTRTVATDRTIAHMIERLRQDVRGARAVALAGKPGEAVELGVGRGGIDVYYAIRDGNVIRTAAGGSGQACWAVPGATIEMRLWPAEGPLRALEVRTSVGEVASSVTRQKLSRTHLLFFDGVEGRAGR